MDAALKMDPFAGSFGKDAHGSLHGFRMLIVDDDVLTRETLKAMLVRLGVGDVKEASHGKEALRVLENQVVDVLLTDIHMPVMDGMELLERVKERWTTVPVLVITGYPTIEIAVDAMKRGASDFIVKPFRLQQVELPLHRAVKERRLLVQNSLLSKELDQKREIEKLNGQLQRKLEELSKLYAISESMQPGQWEGQDLFQKIVDMAAEVTEATGASLMLLDEQRKCLVTKAAVGMGKEVQKRLTVPLGETPVAKAALEGRPLIIRGKKEIDFQRLQGSRGASSISVPLSMAGELFGVLNVKDKISAKGFCREDLTLLSALARKAALALENQALHESLYATLTDTLVSLVSTIEARDPHTRDHSQRVTQWAVSIASSMGLEREDLDMLRFAGYLHDIGKIGIRDSILMKPEALTEEEISVIRTHPIIGERIVKPLGLLPLERSVIRHHHERWDGKGYPDGLRGLEIPLPARILAVADGFDAMTSDRVYRRAMPPQEALKEIQGLAGTQFDKDVVAAFRKAYESARAKFAKS